MSKFKLEFSLKQHTPIIHFQSEQSGATLRATELKPKLDRFLLEHVKGIPFKENANGHRSLDYKVKVEANQSKESQYQTYISKKDRDNLRLKEGSYFGDNQAIKSENVKIHFFAFNETIFNAIEKHFNEFIAISSFGTRNNKGFGNFTNIITDEESFKQFLLNHYIILSTKSDNNPLKSILLDYQKLKSGGRNGVKSNLMEYFYPDIRWGKRWIKRMLKEKKEDWFHDLKDEYHQENDFNFNDDEKYFFLRALLGLAEHNEFLVNSNKQDKLIVKIENIDFDKDKKKIIERYASPIIFKVFNNKIYILIKKNEPMNTNIFNKSFKFTAYYKRSKEDTVELGTLKTPSSFDIKSFLREVL